MSLATGQGSTPVVDRLGTRQAAPSLTVPAFARRGWGAEVVCAVFAGVVFGWRIGTPQPWRDEVATAVVVVRPLGDVLDVLRTVDLVHGLYYVLAHLVVAALGVDTAAEAVTPVRWLSAVVSAVGVGVLVRIGRTLVSTRVGVAAGLALAVSPLASRYAQEARSYALVTTVVAVATLLLVRACEDRRPHRWVLYGAAVALCPLLHLLSILVVVPHGIYALFCRGRAPRRAWATTVAVTAVVWVPWAALTRTQSQQVWWMVTPDLSSLGGFYRTFYASTWLALLLVCALVAMLVRALRGPGGVPDEDGRIGQLETAGVLALAWALAPASGLWLVSQLHPYFSPRYVLYCLPGAALGVAVVAELAVREARRARSARVRRWAQRVPALVVPLALVGVLGVAGVHHQLGYRQARFGHAEDLEGASRYLARHAKQGDAVVFVPGEMRRVVQLTPGDTDALVDVALAEDAVASDTLSGVEKDPTTLTTDLSGFSRIWFVTGSQDFDLVFDDADVAKRAFFEDSCVKTTLDDDHPPFHIYLCRTKRA